VGLAFDSYLHTAVLEPQHYQRTDERGIKLPDLEMMARQLRYQRYCRDLLIAARPNSPTPPFTPLAG
jgi:hypothetical protein